MGSGCRHCRRCNCRRVCNRHCCNPAAVICVLVATIIAAATVCVLVATTIIVSAATVAAASTVVATAMLSMAVSTTWALLVVDDARQGLAISDGLAEHLELLLDCHDVGRVGLE